MTRLQIIEVPTGRSMASLSGMQADLVVADTTTGDVVRPYGSARAVNQGGLLGAGSGARGSGTE